MFGFQEQLLPLNLEYHINLIRPSVCFIHLAPVVQKIDSAIHWINLYPVDNAIGFPNPYMLDSLIFIQWIVLSKN